MIPELRLSCSWALRAWPISFVDIFTSIRHDSGIENTIRPDDFEGNPMCVDHR